MFISYVKAARRPIKDGHYHDAIITLKEPSLEILESHFPTIIEKTGVKQITPKEFYACKPEHNGHYNLLLIGGVKNGNPDEYAAVFPGCRLPDILEVMTLADRKDLTQLSFILYRNVRYVGPVSEEAS